jgi:hypothetical protein
MVSLFIGLAVALCSCGGEGDPDDPAADVPAILAIKNIKKEGDTTMKLATKQELLQYIKDNEVGLTEEDFDGVDIDGFIEHYQFTTEEFARFNLKVLLEDYKTDKVYEQKAEIMAKEIKSVDSTDEEYQAFVEAYLKAVGKEYYFIGADKRFLLDVYGIKTEKINYCICIGKTKNMDKYDISSGDSYGALEIYLPDGDMVMCVTYCYSNDGKFFLFVSPEGDDDFIHELSLIFTEVNM